jgi:hypothetical protein
VPVAASTVYDATSRSRCAVTSATRAFTKSCCALSDRHGKLGADGCRQCFEDGKRAGRTEGLLDVADRGQGRIERVACDENGVAIFDHLRHGARQKSYAVIVAFDLLELDGADLRRKPIEERKRRLAHLLRARRPRSTVLCRASQSLPRHPVRSHSSTHWPPTVKPEMNMLIKCYLTARVAFATTVAGLWIVFMGSTLAHAEHLTRATKSYNEVTIGGYARWNKSCDPIESPQIYLDIPPKNGVVCARTSTGTAGTVREGKAGHCAGRPMRGINLIYLPRSGFTGVDVVRYTVKFTVISQTIDVDISVQSDQTTTGNVGVPASSEDDPQTQGPIPVCVPLVS